MAFYKVTVVRTLSYESEICGRNTANVGKIRAPEITILRSVNGSWLYKIKNNDPISVYSVNKLKILLLNRKKYPPTWTKLAIISLPHEQKGCRDKIKPLKERYAAPKSKKNWRQQKTKMYVLSSRLRLLNAEMEQSHTATFKTRVWSPELP
jgi:hypothetical protein